MWGNEAAVARLHAGAAGSWRATDAMMLTGHDLVPPQLPAVIITLDQQPGDTSTTATLTVGAPPVVAALETVGDQDFFRVTLEAGQAYEFGMYAKFGGPNGVPLADAYIEIYDSAGNLIVSGDGGASTLLNNLNSGFDVLLSYTAETSGTYFVNARAYDQDTTNGNTGDFVGDYELFVREAAPGGYTPYYDVDSPLYALDWGTQVDGSSRNPDGAEGPRPTGNEFTGHAWNQFGITGKNVITYYFARQGEIFIDEDPTTPGTTDTIVASGFEDWEKDVYLNAFGAYSKVADIVYVEVQDRTDADFVLITYEGTPGPGVSLLGRMSPPDEENEGRTEFNANDQRWTEEGLAPGGFSFNTLIHELGHGHGMAHPHDNGGRSGIMRGVEPDGPAFSYTNGDFDLNQGVYTMMSYEDGWEKSPYGQPSTNDPYGWLGSLMAFDVAVIQDKYGVNEEWATGNDTYVLKDVNAPGTFYSCIWDAGGTDSIAYIGDRNANIDLRAASLQYEFGGGGWISYAFGIHGGFTIANGVTIENASSGAGTDTLIGNDAANVLHGGFGGDTMDGGAGVDTADYVGNFGAVWVDLATGVGRWNYAEGDQLDNIENLAGTAYGDRLYGDAQANRLDGGMGHDHIRGEGGNDQLIGGSGNDVLVGGLGADLLDGRGNVDTADYSGNFGAIWINFMTGQGKWNYAEGDVLAGIEKVIGTSFDDLFESNGVTNVFTGGAGNDRFVFRSGFSEDIITDFDGNGAAAGDSIRFHAGVFADFADLLANASQQGSDVVIAEDANNFLVLQNTQLADLHSSDFIFG